MSERLAELTRFYELLGQLAERLGGARRLVECDGRTGWPGRGVYFFFEAGEMRSDSGGGPRVVRVGTHALKGGARTSLWTRLAQHRGVKRSGGGSHRGSIFRKLIGGAVAERKPTLAVKSWGEGHTAPRDVRAREHTLECWVSDVVGRMPFLWLDVPDDPGPESLRGVVERNAIALLSNYERSALDPPSQMWLGRRCPWEKVQGSGLWNNNHVDASYDPGFLNVLERLIADVCRTRG